MGKENQVELVCWGWAGALGGRLCRIHNLGTADKRRPQFLLDNSTEWQSYGGSGHMASPFWRILNIGSKTLQELLMSLFFVEANIQHYIQGVPKKNCE